MEGYINRVIKTQEDGKDVYEIRHAAAESALLGPKVDFDDSAFIVTAGDYNKLLAKVVEELGQAKGHAANDDERSMIEEYMRSFKTGSLDAHKQGSRHWIKNKGPAVETYSKILLISVRSGNNLKRQLYFSRLHRDLSRPCWDEGRIRGLRGHGEPRAVGQVPRTRRQG